MKNERFVSQCIECNKPFSISKKEEEWLRERDLKLFKRCSECRKKRRERNEQ